jgi:hypothetical protein
MKESPETRGTLLRSMTCLYQYPCRTYAPEGREVLTFNCSSNFGYIFVSQCIRWQMACDRKAYSAVLGHWNRERLRRKCD